MGRTVPSTAILLIQEQAHYSQFKKALVRSDQIALEQLFIYANMHVAEVAYTSFELPMETFMLAMILEMHKEVIRLRNEIENIAKGV
jgi:hypothetical protein